MDIKISENIRAFRKERRMTQEQLAEAFSVTVGAVSKWESGASTPELSLIMELADFFETSVDVLLGYEWRSGGMGQAVERIRELRNKKDFDAATMEAEKALQKYPNSFDAVYSSAIMYSLKGVERNCQRSYRRALELFDRALELIGQNKNEKVNEWTIRNNVADIYLCMKQTEEAVERLKQNNADGLNNGSIGLALATALKKPDEALPFLSDALIDALMRLERVSIGYANAYAQKEDYSSAIAVMLWMEGALEGLRQKDAVTYVDRMAVQLYTGCAIIAATSGDMTAAKEYLREAATLARRFDADPAYSFKGTRFVHGDSAMTAFDDFGSTAMEGIESFIESDPDTAEVMRGLWDGIKNEK